MSEQSAAEMLAANIKAMGKPLAEVYTALWHELGHLNLVWVHYDQLFGTSEARVDLLNRTVGGLFGIVQTLTWEQILLGLAKITDRPIIAKKETLSLQRLPALISDPGLKAAVEQNLKAGLNACTFARDWRNRRIAHHSLELKIDRASATPLVAASRRDVKNALRALADVMNLLAMHFHNSETAFHAIIGNPRDGNALVYLLQQAEKSEDDRRKRMEAGTQTSEDWLPPERI